MSDSTETTADPLVFSLTLASKPFTLATATGSKQYTINEITGEERDIFTNFMLKRMTIDPATGKAKSINDMRDLRATLLAYSLRDDNGDKIPVATIRTWPAKMQDSLYREAQIMSGINVEADEDAKND